MPDMSITPPTAGHFPRVERNVFFDKDGTPTQLRLLDVLYFRCGLISLDDLQARFGRSDEPTQS